MDRTDGKVKTEAWAGSSSGNRNPMLGDIILGILLLMSILLILHAVGIRKMSEIDAFRDKFLFPLLKFFRDSIRLVKRCTKPTRKEYTKICIATAVGFALMGFIGFFVKLVHIPINNILVS